MISHLHIENMAIVKNIDIFFSRGLNIITGETGAGKSAIINALNFVFGSRVTRDVIRDGCDGTVVSAVISDITNEVCKIISDLGYSSEDNTVLLYREFTSDGKNICKVNGRPATVSILKQIGKITINIYNQHEGYKILSSDTHINYLDTFAGLSSELKKYKEQYDYMIQIKKKISEISIDSYERERKIELLKYQIEELESAQMYEGEIDKLKEIKNTYDNRKKILYSINESRNILGGDDTVPGVVSSLQEVSNLLESAAEYINSLSPISERIRSLFYEVSECLSDLNSDDLDFDYNDQEIQNIVERLDHLYRLSSKYGKTEHDMIKFLEKARSQLAEIEEGEFKVNSFIKELDKTNKELEKLSIDISIKRRDAGIEFAKKIENELKSLDMLYVKILVHQEEANLGPDGCDKIQFMMSTNKGEPLKPMANIASGGELSRIVLAIKNIVSDKPTNTIVFDEVDTGVSGSAANRVGIKLKGLSKNGQVICITHLAQIASFADEHFLVKKKVTGGHTVSYIKKLSSEERREEIARIIGGINISTTTLRTAEEMISTNKKS